MSNAARYSKYTFRGRSGYILHPDNPTATHELIAVRHTASVPPWKDADVHLHEGSEEYYLLLQGESRLWLAGSLLTLRPREMLLLRPGIPHAVVGGAGPIEHLGLRAPAPDDRRTVGAVPHALPPLLEEEERELQRDWGCRIPLQAPRNQNCWLIGAGGARFPSAYLILAYLDFPTTEAASAGIGTRHRLHLHQRSWEYYAVLRGTKTLQIEDELVEIGPGELLEVPPQVWHTLHSRQAPYEGFTFRVPVAAQDKVESSS